MPEIWIPKFLDKKYFDRKRRIGGCRKNCFWEALDENAEKKCTVGKILP
jgi:hypothetical protein